MLRKTMDGLGQNPTNSSGKTSKHIHHDPSQQKERVNNNRARNYLKIKAVTKVKHQKDSEITANM